MPILVGVIMVQIALSGGLFPVTGALNILSYVIPARWGLGALGATLNLNQLQLTLTTSQNGIPPVQSPDLLWTHDAKHWATAILLMVGLGLVWMMIARLRLATIGPRKRR
jgi:ABC transport system ATP-binding/permease protein